MAKNCYILAPADTRWNDSYFTNKNNMARGGNYTD